MAQARLVLALALVLLAQTAAAQLISHDNSPQCLMVLPTCQERCPAPQTAMFVCSAGNGLNGGPYIFCQCEKPVVPNPPQQAARLVLKPGGWPGAKACAEKTWLNDCTSQMTVTVNGSDVTLTPAVAAFDNQKCAPAKGVVVGRGNQAKVSFPQYPLAITQSGPDMVTFDFSTYGAQDPNMVNLDWSQCIVSYTVVQGSFLLGSGGGAAAAGNSTAVGGAAGKVKSAATGAAAMSLITVGAAAAAGMAALL